MNFQNNAFTTASGSALGASAGIPANGYSTYTMGNQIYYSQPQQYQFQTGLSVPLSLEDKPLSASMVPASVYSAGVEILFRSGRERVKSCVIKGVTDVEVAEEMFLEQYTDEDEKPEVVAAIEVLLAG